MCGIAGYYGLNQRKNLAQSLHLIGHRGPDDRGLYEDEQASVGFAHARLSIMDISPLGHQPMLSADGLCVLVFNGEIYNCAALREGLIDKGCTFLGTSDTEVLLNLYLTEGEAMLSQLNGIFAFALWDARQQKMLIARDALGVKPFYYAAGEQDFVFASEIKGLLPLVPALQALDLKAIQQYLTFLWLPGNGTPVMNIKKLRPGEAMWVKQGQIARQWLWYTLPAFRAQPKVHTQQAAISGVAAQLRQAVQRQMLSDVPVGAFLSGGLDSSAIVAFAREQNPDIPCFTIEMTGGQEQGMTDDLPYARRVAKYLDVPLHVVSISSNQMADNFERMVAMLDEPLGDPASLNVLFISQLARDNGIKVLLSGAGGDDLFTGYRRHYAIQLEQWLQMMPARLRSGIERYTSSLNFSNPFSRRLAKLFSGSNLSADERIVNYFRWADEKDLQALFTPEARAALGDADAAQPMFEFLQPLRKPMTPLERMLVLEQRFFLAEHNLIYTDKMSMAAGVEVRVPFLDLDLVEFSAQISIKHKQRGRVGKWVLKKAMAPYLPHDVIYRPKTGFGGPVRRWMRFELRELLGDLLSEESLRKRGIFEPVAIQRLIKNNHTGVVDASYILFSLMCIEIWCRQFLDGQFNYQTTYGARSETNSSKSI